MAGENELAVQLQINELKKETLILTKQIQDAEKELQEITAGTTEEAVKELELSKKRAEVLKNQLEIDRLILVEKQNTGTATDEEIAKIQELNDLLAEHGNIARKNIKDQQNRIRLLEKEDRNAQYIRTNILGIRKEEERREVSLKKIKEVLATTPRADIVFSIKEKIVETLAALGTKMIDAAISFDKLATSINAATNTGGEFNTSLAVTAATMGRFGINAEKAGEAFKSLRANFSDMSNMTKEAQMELTGFTAKMAVAGISADTTARFLNTATKSMGMGVKQVEQYEKELFAFSRANGISMKAIDSGLAQVMPRLAAFGKDAPRIFKELAFQAKKTGLEMDKLLNITENFTTFEGAAEAAGELNSMLGANLIDSVELLRVSSEDQAKGIEMVRDAMLSTGKSFEDFSNQQKRAFATALKTDPDTLSRIMSMTSEAANEATMSERQFNEAVAEFVPIGEKMQSVFAKLAPAISLLAKGLSYVVDFFAWLLDNPIAAGFVAIVGGFLGFVGVLGVAAVSLGMVFAQLMPLLSLLGLLPTVAAPAAAAVASTGAAAGVAGAEIAAGAEAASAGVVASITTLVTGLGGIAAVSAAIAPLLLPLAAVLLAIGAALFLVGAGIGVILLAFAEVIVAVGNFVKILIEGGTASIMAAYAFSVLAVSMNVLAVGLFTLGLFGWAGIAVLSMLALLLPTVSSSFGDFANNMEKIKQGFDAMANFDLLKFTKISEIIETMANNMYNLANSAAAFSLAMSNPLLAPVMTVIAATKQTVDTSASAISTANVANNTAATESNSTKEIKIIIDSPVMLNDRQVGKFVHETMKKIEYSDEMSLITPPTSGKNGGVP